jgi:hypothetical protein
MKHIASTTGCRVFLKGPNLGHEPTSIAYIFFLNTSLNACCIFMYFSA